MSTFLLTGNPEKGMDRANYERDLNDLEKNGYAEDWWTMPRNSQSKPGDQVVLYRSGNVAGLIGFGVRREGKIKTKSGSKRTQYEFPVSFFNLKSLEDESYLTAEALKDRSIWPSNNWQSSGVKADDSLVVALEEWCKEEFDLPLVRLCRARIDNFSNVASDLAPEDADPSPFDPENINQGRELIQQTVKARRGQQVFREELIQAYEGRCAITGCEILDVLEAAHITPHLNQETNHITNGLLLRSDLHTLLDCGLLNIDPFNRTVILAPKLLNSVDYKHLDGVVLRRPTSMSLSPSEKALQKRISDASAKSRFLSRSDARQRVSNSSHRKKTP